MPIVRIEMLPGRSREAKQRVAETLTQTLAEQLGVEPGHIYVMFSEVPAADWAVGGKLLDAGIPEAG